MVKVFSSTSCDLFEISWYVLRQGSLMALLSSSRILPPSVHLVHIIYSLSKCFLSPSLQVWFCTHWWQGMASSLCYFPPKLFGTFESQFKKNMELKKWDLFLGEGKHFISPCYQKASVTRLPAKFCHHDLKQQFTRRRNCCHLWGTVLGNRK